MLNRPPKTVQHLLAQGTLAELSQRSQQTEQLNSLWQQAVSQELAAATQCLGLQDGVLRVSAATSAWATRLKLTAPHIMQYFQQIPAVYVKQLDIRIDPTLTKQAQGLNK